MKINRKTTFVVWVWTVLSFCSAVEDYDDEKPEERLVLFPSLHQNYPRTFNIFSRPPHPEGEKQIGPGILGHLGNVLHGGSIGIQFEARPLKKVHGIIDHAKKLLPGIGGAVGRPQRKPKPPPAEEPPKKEDWESEEDDWDFQNPEVPKPDDGPHWEDIGENVDDTTVPIEDIIQPRQNKRSRPKRFIESKIYHVPLLFRSNAKPFQIKVKRENDLQEEVERQNSKI